jgi:hypothetical protein
MQYLVLKELPQGQQPGETIELSEDVAAVFMLDGVNAVRPVVDDPPVPSKRHYQRRDLQAVED